MKLHIAVDVLGLPYAAIVTTANISDIAGGIQMFSQPSFYSFSTVQTVLCDGTYEGKNFADAMKKLGRVPTTRNARILGEFPPLFVGFSSLADGKRRQNRLNWRKFTQNPCVSGSGNTP